MTDSTRRSRTARRSITACLRAWLAGCAIFEVVYDSDGQPYDYRYLAVNPAYEHITGTMGPDLIGRTLSETYSNQDPRWYEMKREALSSGGANRYLIHDQQRGRYVEGMIWAPTRVSSRRPTWTSPSWSSPGENVKG